MVILNLLTLFCKIYIPFPWNPINFSTPSGTSIFTFFDYNKNEEVTNFLILTFKHGLFQSLTNQLELHKILQLL